MSVESDVKEASEVLHTLLSVERIEKSDNETDSNFQSLQTTRVSGSSDGETQIHWHDPVPLFSTLDQTSHFVPGINEQQVVVFRSIVLFITTNNPY